MWDPMQRLPPDQARRRIREILERGTVTYTLHAQGEIGNDGMSTVDCENVLRGGYVEFSEWENDAWRYRVVTPRGTCVVVEFDSEWHVVVITAWRGRP